MGTPTPLYWMIREQILFRASLDLFFNHLQSWTTSIFALLLVLLSNKNLAFENSFTQNFLQIESRHATDAGGNRSVFLLCRF